MSTPHAIGGRFRAYAQFIAAVLYYFVVRSLARRGALGLATEQWRPLVEQAMLVFLLLIGYAGFGIWLDRQLHPVSAQGWARRQGWPTEAGVGLAVGWALAVVCVLPMLVVGGIEIVLSTQISAWGWLAVDAAFFALAALAEEIAFRGYGFQRFELAVGPVGASLGFAAFYAIVQSHVPGSNHTSTAVSVMLGLLLSVAYLRTRALWLSWGLNFGWKASRALLFGLTVSGVNSHSPVVQGDPMGPFWLTGGGYGLDASWVAFLLMLAALPVVFRVTRDLDFRYNAPVIVPGGIPVDLDAAARRQHEAATRAAEPAAPQLIQILPAAVPPPTQPRESQTNQPGDSDSPSVL
jgi:membrane protease YdiL (CAAX protease family)